VAILDVFQSVILDQLDAARERWRIAEQHLCTVGERQPNGSYRCGPDTAAFDAACRALQAAIDEAPLSVLTSFSAAQARISGLQDTEWDALERLCGMSVEAQRSMSSPVEVKARPWFFFPGRRLTLFDLSASYDALFAAFDKVARDTASLRDRYGHHVADWMERETERFLLRLFPPSSVFRTVDYPDPDSAGATAELDLAVVWGPFLMLIEDKGRQFRFESHEGDSARLRTDLQTNIAEGFWQARRVIRYLSSVETSRLVERHSGRVLEIQWRRMKRCFPVVVTLEHFAGLATQLAVSTEQRWFRQGTYPWAVSLADFDIITQFAGSPDVFLHYAQRRIQLQESGRHIEGDELDIFGLYLDSRLHPSQFWERTDDAGDFDRMLLSGGSDRFDAWMRAQQDPTETAPEIGLRLPPRFQAIVRMMRSGNDDDARAIVVSLLDLSDEALHRLEHNIDQILSVQTPPGTMPRTTTEDHGLVVVALANRGFPLPAFRDFLFQRTACEKYRTRASRAVGLGFDPGQPTPGLIGAIWIEHPWVQDPRADRSLAEEDGRKLKIDPFRRGDEQS
jgi:hypothetical protein